MSRRRWDDVSPIRLAFRALLLVVAIVIVAIAAP